MRTRLSRRDQDLVNRFEALMSHPPDPLVLRCKICNKLRETTEISDPMLVLQKFSCVELGSSCQLGETVRSNVEPTTPRFVPGSFVIVSNDERNHHPGMIDYTPENHPEFEEYRDSPYLDATLLKGYYVSLLNRPDQSFASGWYFIHQCIPLERHHSELMATAEDLARFEECVAMERSDIRRRLYKFSYMAHTYQLRCTLPPEPRRVPIHHGEFIRSGPSTTRQLHVNIVPDTSDEGNVPVTNFSAMVADPSSGNPSSQHCVVELNRGGGQGASHARREDRSAPPEE